MSDDRADATSNEPAGETPSELTRVAAATDEIAGLPLADQVGQFQRLHDELRAALAQVDHA